jgi:antitoxin component YwqK of YwqJK toxin-antitoxin module
MPSSLKIIVLAMMLAVSMTAQPQEDKTEKYYESGALQFQYSYRKGKLHGTTKEYYETGELKAEYNYKAGQLIAKKEFRHNGDLEYELKYEDGNKYETQIEYYTTGELFRQRTLVNGKREGLEIEFYRNGQKKAERNYIEGKKEGSAKGYHINGNLQGDWIFKNGEPVSATLYYSTGEKWLVHKDFDENGRLNGSSKEYDKQGSLMALRYYEDDEMIKRRRLNRWTRLLYSEYAIAIAIIMVTTFIIGIFTMELRTRFREKHS